MWLFSAILVLLAFASTDILGKKNVDTGTVTASEEMTISYGCLICFGSLLLFASGITENGQPPWRILREHPLILANLFLYIMAALFYLYSLRYIGLSLQSAFSGANGIIYFLGLVLINAFNGKLSTVNDILHPARLIPVLLVLGFTFLYPNVELLAGKHRTAESANAWKDRRRIFIGLLILFFAILFDAGDSLLTTWIFEEDNISILDFLKAYYFAASLPTALLMLKVRKQRGSWFIPFKDGNKYTICYPFLAVAASLLYLFASSLDAVRTGILFTAEPIIPIIGAKVLLKEKYTWRQNVCIWIVTAAAAAFCIADNIL